MPRRNHRPNHKKTADPVGQLHERLCQSSKLVAELRDENARLRDELDLKEHELETAICDFAEQQYVAKNWRRLAGVRERQRDLLRERCEELTHGRS